MTTQSVISNRPKPVLGVEDLWEEKKKKRKKEDNTNNYHCLGLAEEAWPLKIQISYEERSFRHRTLRLKLGGSTKITAIRRKSDM